jgi:hypothetical protein
MRKVTRTSNLEKMQMMEKKLKFFESAQNEIKMGEIIKFIE